MSSCVLPGRSYPLGAKVYRDGVNFCIFSKNCTGLELLLFDDADAPEPALVIRLDPERNRTFHYWHVFVPALRAGQVYAYRAYGPFAPEVGLRFDSSKVLLDPYALAVAGWKNYRREAAIGPGDNCAQALRCVVVDPDAYDWEGDKPLRTPYASTIIYEMHVRGFTSNPNSGVSPERRGTYAGLAEKIPYLQELGVTAVELMPIHQFDEQDAASGLQNYWGYSTMAFFAPHRAYSSCRDPLGPVNEFRDMVKALHRAGIEVILDVVFNHTAEGNHTGPTLSFKGLDNPMYYMLDANPAHYSNYSGCGNSLNANTPVVGNMILNCLRYWVAEMHVDGFRFDLASVLTRGPAGETLERPGILWTIESDPVLAGAKLIAEAWDAAGLYQVGWFINRGDWFAEWNGPFRDDVRRFVRGDSGTVRHLASRILGSSDIYQKPDREPNRSIHFITCHDGFTANDLVSYDRKHNEANGENSRDGMDANLSWNCGEEGPTSDTQVERLRLQQIKNLLTILFVSQGTPMLLMGDEVRRSQLGNNNAYCQNNEIAWFDWDGLEQHGGWFRFVKELIRFTQSLSLFRQERLLELTSESGKPYIIWHGVRLWEPDWSECSHSLAFTLVHPRQNERLHVMLNAYWEPLTFELPAVPPGERWRRIVDTSLPSPDDVSGRGTVKPMVEGAYVVAARAAVVLMSSG